MLACTPLIDRTCSVCSHLFAPSSICSALDRTFLSAFVNCTCLQYFRRLHLPRTSMEESRASLPSSPVVLASLVSIDRACLTSVSGLLLPLLLQYSLRMPRQIVRSCLPTLFGWFAPALRATRGIAPSSRGQPCRRSRLPIIQVLTR